MKITPHRAADYTDALFNLLPPGRAWEWPKGGLGYAMIAGTAEELARVEGEIPAILQTALDTHDPKFSSWHISEYQRVAEAALEGISETFPRKTFAVGSRIGERLWSAAVPDFEVPLVQCFHLFAPMTIGRPVGEGSGRDPAARLWSVGGRTRYILLVRYYRSVVDPGLLRAALTRFRQAHAALWFEDITGAGGHDVPG